jgi:phosphoribosylglycinamide formyltransferase-1
MIRVAILASGTGTNAMKLLHQAKSLKNIVIPLVLVDQPDSKLLETVKKEFPEVQIHLVEAPGIKDPATRREQHEKDILFLLKTHQIDWCFLAGYMRLIGPVLLNAFQGNVHSKIVNIHPSLLPHYPGLNAYEQAFHANESISGVTIHFVDEGLDTGPIIIQQSFERFKGDQLEDFISRGKALEWILYPEILKKLNDEGQL